MNNKGLLIIVIVILLGILAIVFMQINDETPGDQIANDIGEVTEEIGDEIDDNTDAR